VDKLHERLLDRVPQILGKKIRIYRDKKLNGADMFGLRLTQKRRAAFLSPEHHEFFASSRHLTKKALNHPASLKA
jgi:hypothetical protein